MTRKYFKPKSVSWWASCAPLGLGIFLATEPLHGLATWVAVIDSMTGGVGPYPLINAGIAGIGFRGALS